MIVLKPGDDIQDATLDAGKDSLVLLDRGTFYLPSTLVLPHGCQLRGIGTNLTHIRRMGDGITPMIQNGQEGGYHTSVEDLTVDCNFVAFLGVNLWGSHNRAVRVRTCRHVSPMLPDPSTGGVREQESFAILLTSMGPAFGNLIDDCQVDGFAGNYNGGLVIAGQKMADGSIVTCDGTIRNSRYYGNTTTHPHDMIGVMGASVVEGCWMENVALGIYTEGGIDDMMIRNNTFRRIRGDAMRINLENPQARFCAYNNNIHLEGGSALHVYQMQNRLKRLEFFGNTMSGTDPRIEIEGGLYRPRKKPFHPRTTVGNHVLDGDWKKSLS